MNPIRVSLALSGERVRVSATFPALSNRAYYAYKKATEEARYVREVQGRTAPLDRATGILENLRKAKTESGEPFFFVDMTDELRGALRTVRGTQWLDLQAIEERIQAVSGASRMMEHQKTGSRWLALRKKALLADEPGTGKSLTVLAALPASLPVLIIAPAGNRGTWAGEIEKWRPQMSYRVLSGKKSFVWPEPGKCVVTSYSILPPIHKPGCDGYLPARACPGCFLQTLVQPLGVSEIVVPGKHKGSCTGKVKKRPRCPGCSPLLDLAHEGTAFVADEAQYVKNPDAERTRITRALSRAALSKSGRSWVMTGTPIENGPMDLWSILDVADLAEEAFGSEPAFKKFFHVKVGDQGGETYDLPDTEEFRSRFEAVAIRRMKRDVLDLPPKTYAEHYVDIDKKLLQRCQEFATKHGGIDHMMGLLRKNKFPFNEMSSIRSALATAKIPALLDLVDALEAQKGGGPLIVFSSHIAPIEALENRPGWAIIIGDVKGKDRDDIVARFQAGKLKGLACTIKAAMTGLTLTQGNRMVFVDREWNPEANRQAEARFHRISQENSVQIIDMIGKHPLDRRVFEILAEKIAMIDATVNARPLTGDPEVNDEIASLLASLEKEIQEDVSPRAAETEEERVIISSLHTRIYDTKRESVIATDLGEKAIVVGLTPAEWSLASLLALRGKSAADLANSAAEEYKEPVPAKRRGKPMQNEDETKDDERESGELAEDSKRATKRAGASAGRSRVPRVLGLIDLMEPDERMDVIEELSDIYCLATGELRHEDGSCRACSEEDEEEEEPPPPPTPIRRDRKR